MVTKTSPHPSSRGGEEKQNYSELVLDHYRNPRNSGKLAHPTHQAEELNPLCGDEIKVYLIVKSGKIEDISYEARGCALSIAAASMMSERIMNQESGIMEIQKIGKEEIEGLIGVRIGVARESCVMLVLTAINKAMQQGHNHDQLYCLHRWADGIGKEQYRGDGSQKIKTDSPNK